MFLNCVVSSKEVYFCLNFIICTLDEISIEFKLHLFVRLQIEKERVFADISQRHAAAVDWEERAKQVLATRACMSDFEEILRFCFLIFPRLSCHIHLLRF